MTFSIFSLNFSLIFPFGRCGSCLFCDPSCYDIGTGKVMITLEPTRTFTQFGTKGIYTDEKHAVSLGLIIPESHN